MVKDRQKNGSVRRSRVTGFPSPADDFLESRLDLNELLVEHPAATFFMRADEANADLAIEREDILIVDRSLEAVSGSLVVAVSEGELCLHRLSLGKSDVESLEVWGVVRTVIHSFVGFCG